MKLLFCRVCWQYTSKHAGSTPSFSPAYSSAWYLRVRAPQFLASVYQYLREYVHFVLCIVRCVLYIVRCALCSLHMYVLCILYEVQYCLLRTVVDIVCCVYRVPGTVLIRILCMLCTVYCAVCVAEEPSKSRGTKEQAPEAVSHPTRMMTLFQWAIL